MVLLRVLSAFQSLFVSDGSTFGRPKVDGKTAKTKVLESFAQSVCIGFDPAQPLNHKILRASDLRRVSGLTSADALLKG